jgi:hypothetical protein
MCLLVWPYEGAPMTAMPVNAAPDAAMIYLTSTGQYY